MIWLSVALGGALGAMSRYGLTLLIPVSHNGFPWAIWFANVLGSILIALFYVLIVDKGVLALTEQWRLFIVVGFLGALTTFSSFALDGLLLWQNGELVIALIYIISTVVACLVCAGLTISILQRLL